MKLLIFWQIIYNNIPPGIPFTTDADSKSVVITRPNLSIDTVYYNSAKSTPLYVNLKIRAVSGSIDDTYIKSQMETIEFNIGQTAESVNIGTFVKNQIGEVGTPYDVEVSADGVTYAEIATPAGLNEYFTIASANINLQVVSS